MRVLLLNWFLVSLLMPAMIVSASDKDGNKFLDKSFGNKGIVITDCGMHSGTVNYVVPSIHVRIQADDKIVLAGDVYAHALDQKLERLKSKCALIRYNRDGVLDATFGNNGKVVLIPDGDEVDQFTIDCALQKDDRIVLVCRTYRRPGIFPDATVIRLNPDGSLDTSFGYTGVIVEDNLKKNWSNFFKVMIQDDGKIITAGGYGTDMQESDDMLNCCFYLVRYLPDGSLDTSFGDKGKVKTFVDVLNRPKPRPHMRAGDVIVGAQLQADGKIIVVGYSLDYAQHIDWASFDASHSDSVIARYNSDGTLDTSFGENKNGLVITSASEGCNLFTDVTVAADNKIIALGTAKNMSTEKGELLLVRYTHEGFLDTSFGRSNNGIVLTPVGTDHAVAKNIVVQKDGKIVVTGVVQWGKYKKFTVIRYTQDGLVDDTFGDNGILVTTVRAVEADAKSFSLAEQNDGKMVLAGDSFNGSYFDFALVRYISAFT